MKLKFSQRELRAILLVGGLGLLILWVYATYLLGPLRWEASSVGQQLRSAREQLKALEAVTANEATVREQYRQVDQTVMSLRGFLPGEEEIPSVMQLLSDLASQAQVKIQTLFPQRPLAVPELTGSEHAGEPPRVYKEVFVQIDALAGYHQLGTFLALVESQERPMRVSSLRISANPKEPKRHFVKLLLQSYFATSHPTSAASQKPQGQVSPNPS